VCVCVCFYTCFVNFCSRPNCVSPPQTIEDAHVRSSKNEPSNLPYVYAAVAAAIGTDADSLAKSVTDNAMRFYALTQSTHKVDHRCSCI